MGTQRIPVPKAFGCSHHRLPPKAHSSSSDLPWGRNGACGSAGNEPKSGLSSALELAFAMLPYNTKRFFRKSVATRLSFYMTSLKVSLHQACRKQEIKEKHRKASHKVEAYLAIGDGRATLSLPSSGAAAP